MQTISLSNRIGRPRSILCLGAHSDDIEIGCGGTVLKLLREAERMRQAALDPVSQWRFRPAVLNGQPTSTLPQIRVNFTLPRYRQRKPCDDASEERQA